MPIAYSLSVITCYHICVGASWRRHRRALALLVRMLGRGRLLVRQSANFEPTTPIELLEADHACFQACTILVHYVMYVSKLQKFHQCNANRPSTMHSQVVRLTCMDQQTHFDLASFTAAQTSYVHSLCKTCDFRTCLTWPDMPCP